MIKVRLQSLGEGIALEYQIKDGDTVHSATERVLEGKVASGTIPEYFQVLVNGVKIPAEMWGFTKISSSDTVLIAPIISGDSGRGLFSLAIILAASYFAGPAGFNFSSQFTAGAFVAGASMAGGLLLNALIPLPILKNTTGSGDDVSSSQMYSISGQSNGMQRFGYVPKVYGTHRMFPTLAANPYTEIENATKGTLVQYYYAIFDFGLGPVNLSDIRIGDTPLNQFTDKFYQIVDPNRPDVDEGDWDVGVSKTFKYYKGDNTLEVVGVTFTQNQNDASPSVANYQATRNSAPNPLNYPQTITLTMASPQLIAYDSTGKAYQRTIDLSIEFSKVGEENWRQYNDLNYVSSVDSKGGLVDNTPVSSPGNFSPFDPIAASYIRTHYDLLLPEDTYKIDRSQPFYSILTRQERRGYFRGTTVLTFHTNSGIALNQSLFLGDEFLGKVIAINADPFLPTLLTYYTLDRPLSRDIAVFTVYETKTTIFATTTITFTDPNRTGDSIFNVRNISTGTARVVGKSTTTVYATFRFTPREQGEFKVRVTRKASTSPFSTQVQDTLTWQSLATRLDTPAIVTDKRHTFLELKILATNQLNGSISNLSAVATSVLDVHNGTSWVKAPTSNPAWIFADLLTGEINKRPISKDRLDVASLREWAEFCSEIPDSPPDDEFVMPRYSCNFVLDYASTLQQSLNQISTSAQATLNIVDGKYGVLLDTHRTVPVQLFTPRNCKNFSSSRNFSPQPDAINVSYVDPEMDWNVVSVPVYDDGFTADNATDFEEVTAFAATNAEQAWRFGRYMIAQNRLRQETITIDVDFEYLVCARGDYVQITQDAMLVGGTPARVIYSDAFIVIIDEGVENNVEFSYGYVFRGADGVLHTGTVTDFNSSTELVLAGDTRPEPGDLIVIGEVNNVVYDCIVKTISPNSDMTATLTLVERADAVHSAESGAPLSIYDPRLSPTINGDFTPPGAINNLTIADQGYECANGGGYDYYVDLTWDIPNGGAYEIFEVYVDEGFGLNLVATTKRTLYRYILNQSYLGEIHSFTVLAVSATGKKINLAGAPQVGTAVYAKTSPPSSIANLNTDITGEVLQLLWERPIDCDIREYLIRYSPLIEGASWESSIPLLRVDRNTTLAATQARTGSYLIKPVDYNGNEAVDAALTITTIPNLFGLNVITSVTDFPDLNGTLDNAVKIGGAILLENSVVGGVATSEYYPVGYYYYEDFLDLSEIYTVRLQSYIQAEGNTEEDIMANWETLSEVTYMARSRFSEWDVEAQYRSTNVLNVIADWVSMDSIDPISEGNQENFTPWRKFLQSDATGRIFQFRLKLISNKASVSPRVFDGLIKADMPDRFESYNDLFVPGEGVEIEYDPAFFGPGISPNLQFTIEDAEAGDRPYLEYKTLEGFKLFVVNENGSPVERYVDVAVKGFGRQALNVI